MVCIALSLNAQNYMGKVYDEKMGDPLIGASVIIKGSTTGTITGIDGEFNIAASKGDVLEIAYLGFNTYEIQINEDTGSDLGTISMAPSGVGLEDVVITGVMDIVRDRKT